MVSSLVSGDANFFLTKHSIERATALIKEVVDPYMGKFFEVLNDPVSCFQCH